MNAVLAAHCRQFFEYLLNPLFWVLFILLGLVIYLVWPGQTKGAKRAGWGLFCVWLLFFAVSTPWLSNIMLVHFEQQFSRIETVDKNIHWVVVLGGGASQHLNLPAGEVLSNASLRRVFEGVRLYEALPDAKLLLSGGSKYGAVYAEANSLFAIAKALQVPKKDIVLELDSLNTKEEARAVKAIVGDAPFYLVTSALHMPRSMQLFLQQGMHPVPAPCNYLWVQPEVKKPWMDSLPNAINIVRFNVAWHEYLGQAWALLKQSN